MKRDGRSFDHRTLEAIRLMAVERVLAGEPTSADIASYGFNRTTIYKWIKAVSRHGIGVEALRARRATGRPRSLTPRQEQQVFHWVNGKDPRQYGLDFGLWTRRVVADLIDRKFGIRLGLTAVGELLAKLGLTPQKPLQRAYQRDPEAIERWRRETFPSIARKAKEEEGEVDFWDESGFRADAVHGKTWGAKGHTPVVGRPGQRQSISAASAVNSKGAFWYCTYEGGLTAELFVALLNLGVGDIIDSCHRQLFAGWRMTDAVGFCGLKRGPSVKHDARCTSRRGRRAHGGLGNACLPEGPASANE